MFSELLTIMFFFYIGGVIQVHCMVGDIDGSLLKYDVNCVLH